MLLSFEGNTDDYCFVIIDGQIKEPAQELKSLGGNIDACFNLKKHIS